MLFAGIDAGSRAVKIAIFDASENRVVQTGLADQGIEQEHVANNLLESALERANLARSDLNKIVATGYSRNLLSLADTTITEITCHARGVRFLHPEVRSVVEIGGQDSKLIHLDENGKVRDFVMNDRCAAGTGRFLEMIADRLETPLHRLGSLADQADQPAAINSMCAIFAESEIIGLLASGVSASNIIAGVQSAIARRIASMSGSRLTDPIVFTGGVANVAGMDRAMMSALNREIQCVPDPQMTGAIGASLLASRLN